MCLRVCALLVLRVGRACVVSVSSCVMFPPRFRIIMLFLFVCDLCGVGVPWACLVRGSVVVAFCGLCCACACLRLCVLVCVTCCLLCVCWCLLCVC